MDTLYDAVAHHHDTLAAWLGGQGGPEVLDHFRAAHHPDFALITIDGTKLALDDLMTALGTAHNAAPGLTITIDQFELITQSGDTAVCRFLEQHSTGTTRWTTAVLTGPQWLSVQETAVL
ncbi:hypothetical protein E1263_31015 [Kribbella antibiotica]|uniref:DUF4440 domain-containing protein n=1 Tax=Kribbella antibiotica TaxID=190195 RepID=A0A4R4YYA0_9ACTN|nr:hypothetical protein [Kribbella antibiotica]TDD50491.1 hypothetical protein E1263_31015 [Kribbella antibiotica]